MYEYYSFKKKSIFKSEIHNLIFKIKWCRGETKVLVNSNCKIVDRQIKMTDEISSY